MSEKITRINKKFNWGIEILRIFSMYMIVILHILNKGGVLESTSSFSFNYEVGWFLEILVICAVNCFGLISGFVGYNSHYRYLNILYLWLRVMFYSVGISVLFFAIEPNYVTMNDWKMSIAPVMTNHYWYFTAYVGLAIFIPLLNIAIENMTKNQHFKISVCLFVFYSLLQTVFREDTFKMDFGYSVWWLLILYIIGAYVGKYVDLNKYTSSRYLGYYFVSVLVTWGSKYCIELLMFRRTGEINGGGWFLDYTSPTMLLAGLFLVLFFASLKVNNTLVIDFLKKASPLAFSVYIIHTQKIIWNKLLFNRFMYLADKSTIAMVAEVLGVAFIVLVICMVIDFFRDQVFKILKIKKRLYSIVEIIKIEKIRELL